MKLGEIIREDRERFAEDGFTEWRCSLLLATGAVEGVYIRATLEEVKHHIKLRLDGPKPPVAAVATRWRFKRAHTNPNPRLDSYRLIDEVAPEWVWQIGGDL